MNKIIGTEKEYNSTRKEQIKIHIKYNSPLTLRELVEVLNLTNKSINDVNRENGVKSNIVLSREYAPEVYGVESGSIVLYVISNFVVPLAIGVLAGFIYERLKNFGAKKEKGKIIEGTGYLIRINTDENSNTIEIKIIKPDNNNIDE